MSHQQRIIELQNEIARLKCELDQERNAYLDEALEKGIKSEDFGDWRFQVRRKPATLDLDKATVPEQFYKQTINQKAVRQYLKENGSQSWGTLKDGGPMLVVKHIHGHAADALQA